MSNTQDKATQAPVVVEIDDLEEIVGGASLTVTRSMKPSWAMHPGAVGDDTCPTTAPLDTPRSTCMCPWPF